MLFKHLVFFSHCQIFFHIPDHLNFATTASQKRNKGIGIHGVAQFFPRTITVDQLNFTTTASQKKETHWDAWSDPAMRVPSAQVFTVSEAKASSF
jgi:hypothetical protein